MSPSHLLSFFNLHYLDNAINQTILSTFMRRNKIKYEVAWNGREAVEKWRNGNFHLILVILQLLSRRYRHSRAST